MWIERILAGEHGKPSPKKAKRAMTMAANKGCAVQTLFDTCVDVFSYDGADLVPSAADVERLQVVLDDLKPEDVGLSQKLPYFKKAASEGPPTITYMHVYECDRFSIGIFCLPQFGVIPLHNHPGMTVFSKLLFGSMHVKSYDWLEALPGSIGIGNPPLAILMAGVGLAKLQDDVTVTASCKTSILYPHSGGNMHCFSATTACAVIDVLGPPYSDHEGRHCTYYMASPYGPAAIVPGNYGLPVVEEYAWLQEIDKPDDFFVVGAKYRGPKIVDHLLG